MNTLNNSDFPSSLLNNPRFILLFSIYSDYKKLKEEKKHPSGRHVNNIYKNNDDQERKREVISQVGMI